MDPVKVPDTFESRADLEDFLISWTRQVCDLKEDDWDEDEWDCWVDRVWVVAQIAPIDGMLTLLKSYCEMTAVACGMRVALVGAYQMLRAHGEQLDGLPYYEELADEVGDFRELPMISPEDAMGMDDEDGEGEDDEFLLHELEGADEGEDEDECESLDPDEDPDNF